MKIKYTVLAILLVLSINRAFSQDDNKTKEDKNRRMEWWRNARFGMFIHWGLYSIPAGQWGRETNHAEWIRETAKIPVNEYEGLLNQFNPVLFDAEAWVKFAKDAGMKYIVLTSKHHDGFCLFDTKYTNFTVMNTPFKRDILKELADACRKYDMKICWYHSIMDWHHPDYLPRREWETKIRPAEGADFDRYIVYLKNELKEILTNYGDISVLWFDGEWESTWNHKYAQDLYKYLRELKPDLIINNRIDTYRDGMGGLSKNPEALGDYGTPEQEIPENGLPDIDWETCMTMNDHWGFNKFDNNWKSARDLIYNLVDVASKGGNYLLNVGPTSEGLLPPQSIERLKEIGNWMKINSESIYGTKASPFKNLSWGKCTQKAIQGGTLLYFNIFDWPMNNKIVIDNLLNETVKAYVLSDPKKTPILFKKKGISIEIPLLNKVHNKYSTVIVLEIKGKPQVVDSPEFTYKYDEASNNLEISMKTKLADDKLKIHYTLDGKAPTTLSPVFTQLIKIKKDMQFKAVAYYGMNKVGNITKIKLPISYGRMVKLTNTPSEKYKANGTATLTDGNTGTKSFTDNNYLGFEGNDFVATIDLGKLTNIHKAGLNYLVETRSWIFEPTEIIIEASNDGINFTQIAAKKFDSTKWKEAKGMNSFNKAIKTIQTRYIRFTAKNRATCPDDHPGAGGKAWVFISEITVD